MGNTFSFATIIPIDAPTFTDTFPGGDGQSYTVRLSAMFNSYEYAQMGQLQNELPERLAAIMAAKEQGEEAAQAAQLLDQTANTFLRLLVPDLPEERVKQIALSYKLEFLKWWKQQLPAQPKAADQVAAEQRMGEVAGRAKTRRGKRSPDSSASTA